ncbi:kinase-like domain-containing protein, partial [Mycotypha africana]|uniref:kinase-like domain-containing protein n=1 Tax=Mycotypha africana TaxID=64632 RepID=UPI00230091FF
MLLRVYGVGCDQLLDRNKELNWLSHLSQLNIGPKMLATFGNGRLEEYLPSTTLTSQDIRNTRISAQIASRLHQLHSIVQIFPPDEAFDEPLNVWTMIEKWYTTLVDILPQLNSIYPELNLDLIELREKIDACKTFLSKSDSPIVFAHNDAQYGNILKIEGSNELVVIDFEYAGYNPRAYDIVNHFCEWMYDYHSTTHPTCQMIEERYPTKEEQLNFLSSYLNHTQNQEEIEAAYEEVNQWRMTSHLFWSLWGFVQASQSEIEFDYYAYSKQRLAAFEK